MSSQAMAWIALLLMTLALASALAAWRTSWSRPATSVSLVLLLSAAAVAGLPAGVGLGSHTASAVAVSVGAALAIAGGGPVTVLVFGLVDRATPSSPPSSSVGAAGLVLRGGAWIGCLERTAIFVSLVSGMSEGIAVVLALKALGRYPELRNGDVEGVAERFIIGTFTSLLHAGACAGVTLLVT